MSGYSSLAVRQTPDKTDHSDAPEDHARDSGVQSMFPCGFGLPRPVATPEIAFPTRRRIWPLT
jgi:hypothetical protein